MKKLLYYTGLGLIALFLFVTHSKFLFTLDPGKESELFVFFGYDAKQIIPYIFGAAFGAVATIAIALLDKRGAMFAIFVAIIAILELIGVFLYNNTEIAEGLWTWFASSYYAIYTAVIIAGYAYISDARLQGVAPQLQEDAAHVHAIASDASIIAMHETGMNNADIAKETGVHPSTISRRLKKIGVT